MNCENCAFPMHKPEDHGVTNKYCKFCAPDGKLRKRGEVREGWINAVMEMDDLSRKEAEKKVDGAMPKMPAWKDA